MEDLKKIKSLKKDLLCEIVSQELEGFKHRPSIDYIENDTILLKFSFKMIEEFPSVKFY